MRNYIALGADAVGSGPFVVVHVRDVPAVAKSQGGSIGALVQSLAPQAVEKMVYQKMVDQIASGMKDKGVDADVRVVSSIAPGSAPLPASDFWKGAAVGAGAIGAIVLAVKFISKARSY